MTPDLFAKAVAKTRMQGDTIEAARLVLVYGTSQVQAAEKFGRTKQWARQAVARVQSAARDLVLCPDGWEVITVCLPPEDAIDVREMEQRRRDALTS